MFLGINENMRLCLYIYNMLFRGFIFPIFQLTAIQLKTDLLNRFDKASKKISITETIDIYAETYVEAKT